MKVRASIPSVEEIEVDVSEKAKVADLKQQICDKMVIEPSFTTLLLDGKPLSESSRLADLDLASKRIVVDYFWARHLILWGKEGQSRIRNSVALLAGAGALGNEVAKNLAMLGIKRLLIVDYDTVELSNISRMVFFDKEDLGKPKAKVLAEKLMKKYPHVEIHAYDIPLEKLSLEVFLAADVIVSGLDNVVSRIFLSSISRKHMIPIVDGGVIGYHARVQVYIPPDSPCPICPLPAGHYGELVGLRNPCDAPLEEAKTPSLPTTISMVSSIQTQEALKILVGHQSFVEKGKWPPHLGEPLKGILIADLKFNRYSILELKKNKNCIVCGKEGTASNTVPRFKMAIDELTDSTNALATAIESRVGTPKDEILLFKINDGKTTKIDANRRLSEYRLNRKNFIQVVFTKKKNEYEEAIVELI